MANIVIPPWLEPQPIPQLYAQGMNTGVAAAAQQNEARRAAAALQQQAAIQSAAMQQEAAIQAARISLERDIAAQRSAQAAVDSQIERERNAAMLALREQESMNNLAYRASQLETQRQRLDETKWRNDIEQTLGWARLEQQRNEAANRLATTNKRFEDTLSDTEKSELSAAKTKAQELRKQYYSRWNDSDYANAIEAKENTSIFSPVKEFFSSKSNPVIISQYDAMKSAEDEYKNLLTELGGAANQSTVPPFVQPPAATNAFQQPNIILPPASTNALQRFTRDANGSFIRAQ